MAVSPVYAVIGEDAFLQLQALEDIASRLPKDTQRNTVEGASAQLAEVLDDLRSYSLFGGHKLVVMREAGEFVTRYRENLERYLAEPAAASTLVLRLDSLPANQRVYKLIDKLGGIAKCETPKNLGQWVQQRAKAGHKLAIDKQAADTLADLVGADLGRLDSEIAKLALRFGAGPVSSEQVRESCAFQREQQMWDLTNALGGGDVAGALRKWRQLLQMDSSAEFRIFVWLTILLENLRTICRRRRLGLADAELGRRLRVWDRGLLGRFIKTADTLGEEGIVAATSELAEVERRSKSGLGSAAGNVERFIATVGARLAG